MTPLRAKYIRDLVIHGRSKHTQEAYTRYVCDLARYYRRSPELISYEQQVTGWLYHLIKERQEAIAHGSAAAWGHLNLLGKYDFSEDKLQDSVGIKPPKLTD